jgi:hypothetical protein
MKLKRAQFLKMNARREENPPLREIGCPDYRSCLDEAAFKNLCLDCSRCDSTEKTDERPVPIRIPRPNRHRRLPEARALAI